MHFLMTQRDFNKVKQFKTEKDLLGYAKKQGTRTTLIALSGEARCVETAPTLRPMGTAAASKNESKRVKKSEEKKPKPKSKKRERATKAPATNKVTVTADQLLVALETAGEPMPPREIANLLGATTQDLRAPYAELRERGQADSSGWGKGAKWRAVPKKAPPGDLVGPEARS